LVLRGEAMPTMEKRFRAFIKREMPTIKGSLPHTLTLIESFISEEKERSRLEGLKDALPAFPVISEKSKRAWKIEGARELVKILNARPESFYDLEIKNALSKLEKDNEAQ
jgi:dihydropteroate synthase